MKFAATLLLCVVTTNPANKPDRNTGKHSAASEEKPNSTVSFIDNRTSAPEDKTTEQKSPDWYATSAPAEWALVLVGIAGVIAAIKSLKAINSQISEMRKQVEVSALQVRAMQEQITEMSKQTDVLERSVGVSKESADAALLNAKALINAERPLVVIEWEKSFPEGGGKAVFKISAVNYGKSPARITSCNYEEIACSNCDRELQAMFYPFPRSRRNPPIFLTPMGNPYTVANFAPESSNNVSKRLAASQSQGENFGAQRSVIYGEIRYHGGIQTDEPYTTRFCFQHTKEPFSEIGGVLIFCGPNEYNDYT